MGHYAYKAYGKQGMCKGKISAASRAEAAECLRRQGLLPVHIEEARKVLRKNGRRREQILLFQEWSALLSAGLPMDEVFRLLARHDVPLSGRGRTVRTDPVRGYGRGGELFFTDYCLNPYR